MAKPQKAHKAGAKPPKIKQAGKPAAKKDRTGKERGGKDKKGKSTGETTTTGKTTTGTGDKSKGLPKPRLKPADVRTLQTLIERLPGMVADAVRDTLQQHEQRAAQASVPVQPSPHEEVFAQLPELMSQIEARLTRIEAAQQQPARDPQLDVPASVTRLRRSFAGACKTLAVHQPTPAIIGRIMHDKEIFSPDENIVPRRLFEAIYAKQNIPNHLSQKIRVLLERYTEQPSQTNTNTNSESMSLTQQQQQQSNKRPKAPSSKIAEELGAEFEARFALIVNTGDGKREPIQTGKKTNYQRHLMPSGCELFDGWPEWTDGTGGIGLADEQTPPDPNASGRPVIEATAPPESQPASPPPAEPPASQPPPPSPT
jgi:hypothetical protein